MWQFAEAVRGLADGCQTLGTPVTGGNVSFYNQTGTTAILPTPVIGVLGVIDDVAATHPAAASAATAIPSTCSATRATSSAARSGHAHARLPRRPAAGGRPRPRAGARRRADRRGARGVDRLRARPLRGRAGPGARRGLPARRRRRARRPLPAGADPFVALFSESTGRAIVSLPRGAEDPLHRALRRSAGCRTQRIGVADLLVPELDVEGQFRDPAARAAGRLVAGAAAAVRARRRASDRGASQAFVEQSATLADWLGAARAGGLRRARRYSRAGTCAR